MVRRGCQPRRLCARVPAPLLCVHPAIELAGCTRSSDHPNLSHHGGWSSSGRRRFGNEGPAVWPLAARGEGHLPGGHLKRSPPSPPWLRPRAGTHGADGEGAFDSMYPPPSPPIPGPATSWVGRRVLLSPWYGGPGGIGRQTSYYCIIQKLWEWPS